MTVPPQEPADPPWPALAPGALDPRLDPDRYDPAREAGPSSPGQGQTLPELLGDGAFEEPRSGYEWAVGLVTVLGFLVLVSWFFGSVASP